MGHFLALIGTVAQVAALSSTPFNSYGLTSCFIRVVRLFCNSLAIIMALVVGVLRARSFLRLRLPFSACSIRALTSLETAFSLWPFVFSFAHFVCSCF